MRIFIRPLVRSWPARSKRRRREAKHNPHSGIACGTPSQVHASETPQPPPMSDGHQIAKVLVVLIDAEAEFNRAGNAASERLKVEAKAA